MNNCPICNEPAILNCKCPKMGSKCKNRHSWHICTVHNSAVIGECDHSRNNCTCIKNFTIKRETDGIGIYLNGDNMLFWNESEWIEDSDVAYVIVEAIRQAYEEPDKLYKYLEDRGMFREVDENEMTEQVEERYFLKPAHFVEFEKLLREAGENALADGVYTGVITDIFNAVVERGKCTPQLRQWYNNWVDNCE